MRIAICLSGQPRAVQHTAQSVLRHFSGEHEYDFFCHTWNTNTWKTKKDQSPESWNIPEKVEDTLIAEHLSIFNPKKMLIEDPVVLNNSLRIPWASMFYSMLQSMTLKKKYEIENNFTYDLVVKCRYDIVFDPNRRFTPHSVRHLLDVYVPHAARMARVFQQVNVSDVIFYGSSVAMDMLGDIYWYILNRKRISDDDYAEADPGILMYKYANMNNMQLHNSPETIEETVYRREMVPIDPIKDYLTVSKIHREYYGSN